MKKNKVRFLKKKLDINKGCKNKNKYMTYEHAKEVLEKARETYGGLEDKMPYLCRFCTKYHIGGNKSYLDFNIKG